MKTFVLVHGGWQGGWSYRLLARRLRSAGYEVYTPTFTGLGERSHLSATTINLETHILDVVNTILWEDLDNIVLVGHSYGGMVITGVADRLAERIASLVYLDALVPEDGSTLFSLRPEYLAPFLAAAGDGAGLTIAPPAASSRDTKPEHWPWLDAKTTPHPFACFVQPLSLSGCYRQVPRRFFIYASGGICDGMYDQFRDCPNDRVISIADSGHSIMIDQPEQVADILLAAAQAD
ncbi:MAG: alpha/beta hydrolase [Porticoccaceae bacterium]|nr:alpha/beta hydrolase [Porticoccaceae bacterium]